MKIELNIIPIYESEVVHQSNSVLFISYLYLHFSVPQCLNFCNHVYNFQTIFFCLCLHEMINIDDFVHYMRRIEANANLKFEYCEWAPNVVNGMKRNSFTKIQLNFCFTYFIKI